MKRKVDRLKNFGYENETSVVGIGVNANLNELQAALGLLQLKHIDGYIAGRKRVTNLYREKLKKYHIYGRRYFYPLISQFPAYKHLDSARPGNLPVAEQLTGQVLCLPLSPDLADDTLDMIVQKLRE